jgi:glycosyltransferase involved in cell wall biosynthesis
MKKIAIVVQRCHKSIVGGSEAEAWHYAGLLKNNFKVDILTTAALDFATWDNELESGVETLEDICIRRFEVTHGRADHWANIHIQLVEQYNRSSRLKKPLERLIKWPTALQEEFIYNQGPYSEGLMEFLAENNWCYDVIIFLTYLYPTTYFGVFQVPTEKVVLVPTLHDEPPAYLSVYKYMAKRARTILWNTASEKDFACLLWGKLPGDVVGLGVNTGLYPAASLGFSYMLYCGRIDINKGCQQLIDFFLKYKKKYPGDLHLILTGDKKMDIDSSKSIKFMGNVPEKEKFELMRGADFFVMPSPNESFSIVTLEAMAQECAILAAFDSPVVVEHIRRSKAGVLYDSFESFCRGINSILKDKAKTKSMGRSGRKYVIKNYSIRNISKKLNDIITRIS